MRILFEHGIAEVAAKRTGGQAGGRAVGQAVERPVGRMRCRRRAAARGGLLTRDRGFYGHCFKSLPVFDPSGD